MRGYPYAFYVALDGNGANGLEGMAGMCLFLYDPATERYAWKVSYYDGIAAGHACSVESVAATSASWATPASTCTSSTPRRWRRSARVSTLRFETPRHLAAGQHAPGLAGRPDVHHRRSAGTSGASRSTTSEDPERLEPHGVTLPHAMKLTASGRYLCYGSMD